MTPPVRLDTPDTYPTIGDLRAARDTLLAAGDASSAIVARALANILVGGCAATALGLKASAGRRSALTTDRIAARERLLRQMADRHYPDRSASAKARAIVEAATAYWRRAARADADLEQMPESYVGMPREFLFHIARLQAAMPSMRTVRLALAGTATTELAASTPYSLPTERSKSFVEKGTADDR